MRVSLIKVGSMWPIEMVHYKSTNPAATIPNKYICHLYFMERGTRLDY